MDNGKMTGAVFIDLSKAFDTISDANLLNKLPNYGIKDVELQWFRDYLSNHHQSVVYDKHCSNPLPVSCGVPQGFLLGALLFLIHFNDVEDCLMNSEAVMYADDTVIIFLGQGY